jgi:hypothetical protein
MVTFCGSTSPCQTHHANHNPIRAISQLINHHFSVGLYILPARDFVRLIGAIRQRNHRYAGEQPAVLRAEYARAEDAARGERSGLWSGAAPVPPWDYRRAQRAAVTKE